MWNRKSKEIQKTFTSNNRGLCNTLLRSEVKWVREDASFSFFTLALCVRIFKQRKIVNNERANTMKSTWKFFCSFWWCFACKPVIILFTAPPFTQTHTLTEIWNRLRFYFSSFVLSFYVDVLSYTILLRLLKNHLPIDGGGGAWILRR